MTMRALGMVVLIVAGRVQGQCDNELVGDLNGDLLLDEACYRVTGDVFVRGTLTISPGVRLEFEGDYVLQVTGILKAVGTAAERIVFTSSPSSASWKGIFFDNTQPGSELVFCTIEYANSSGIRLYNSLQRIEDCVVQNCTKTGGTRQGGGIEVRIKVGDLILRRCDIVNNRSQYFGGI